MMIPTIGVSELKEKIDAQETFILLDVREDHEHSRCAINYGDSPLIPVGSLEERLGELDSSKPYVCYCRSGARSAHATQLLLTQGIEAENLEGGILAWADEIDSSIEKY